MHVAKKRLPEGLSYPLKTSALVTALEQANVTLECSLNYYAHPQPVRAHFWPPNANVPSERLYLTVGAVTSATAERERQHVSDVVLPALVAWIKAILAQPLDSPIRREENVFDAGVLRRESLTPQA